MSVPSYGHIEYITENELEKLKVLYANNLPRIIQKWYVLWITDICRCTGRIKCQGAFVCIYIHQHFGRNAFTEKHQCACIKRGFFLMAGEPDKVLQIRILRDLWHKFVVSQLGHKSVKLSVLVLISRHYINNRKEEYEIDDESILYDTECHIRVVFVFNDYGVTVKIYT